jgi:rare lipoprotein A
MYDGNAMPQLVVSPRCAPAVYARALAAVLIMAGLGGCASHHHAAGSSAASARGMYKIGAPYTIDGVTYTPQEEFDHVETGVASWYGPGFHGKYTANGEVFDQAEHTAAHRTLQMPSVVRVTNLETGQSTIVRVNDRGPYARNRVLDLSRAAAEELGMMRNGTARVRIDQLHMESEAVKEIAVNGGGAAEQQLALAKYAAGRRGPPAVTATAQATPPTQQPQSTPPTQAATPAAPPRSPAVATLQASGEAGPGSPTIASLANGTTPAAFHPGGGFYVQTGAFSTMTNAEHQRDQISSYGTIEITPVQAAGREVYRVRLGPYTTSDAAGIVADRLKRSGYGDARVVAD